MDRADFIALHDARLRGLLIKQEEEMDNRGDRIKRFFDFLRRVDWWVRRGNHWMGLIGLLLSVWGLWLVF